MVGNKRGQLSVFSYKRINLAWKGIPMLLTNVCCIIVTQMLSAKGHKGRGGVLRKRQWKSYANSDGTERDKDRLRDNFPFITTPPPPPLHEMLDRDSRAVTQFAAVYPLR